MSIILRSDIRETLQNITGRSQILSNIIYCMYTVKNIGNIKLGELHVQFAKFFTNFHYFHNMPYMQIKWTSIYQSFFCQTSYGANLPNFFTTKVLYYTRMVVIKNNKIVFESVA